MPRLASSGCPIALAALLAGCAPTALPSGDAGATPGQLLANPLVFGPVALRSSATAALTLFNDGGLPVAPIDGQFAGPAAADFGLPSPLPSMVAASGMATLPVSFTPSDVGPRGATLLLTLADRSQTAVPISATGVPLPLALAPPSLAFGAVPLGGTRVLQFTATNLDPIGQPLAIAPLAADAGFALAGESAAALDPGAVAVREIAFAPTALGDAAAALSLTLCAGCAAVDLPLTGSGVAPPLATDPALLDLGPVNRGRSGALAASLRNLAGGPLTVTAFALQSDGGPFALAPDFSGGAGLPLVLDADAGETLPFTLGYAPPSTSPTGQVDSASLRVGYAVAGVTAVATFTARASVQGDCLTLVDPAGLEFGLAVPGAVLPPQTVVVRNGGRDSCILRSQGFVDGGDPVFAQLGDGGLPAALPPLASAVLTFALGSGEPAPPFRRSSSYDFNYAGAGAPGSASGGASGGASEGGRASAVTLGGWIGSDAYGGDSPCPRWRCDPANSGRSRLPLRGDGGLNRGALGWIKFLNGKALPPGVGAQAPNATQPIVGADGQVYGEAVAGPALLAFLPDGGNLWAAPLNAQASSQLPSFGTPALLWDGTSILVQAGGDISHVTSGSSYFVSASTVVTPVLLDRLGRLILGDSQGNIALRGVDRTTFWSTSVGQSVDALALGEDGLIFFSTAPSASAGWLAVGALTADGGFPAWTNDQFFPLGLGGPLALDQNLVLVPNNGLADAGSAFDAGGEVHSHLTALDEGSGALLWDYRSPFVDGLNPALTPAVRADGTILYLTADPPDAGANGLSPGDRRPLLATHLTALAPDGGRLWETELPLGGAEAVTCSADGYAMATGPIGLSLVAPDGGLLWTTATLNGGVSPAVVGPGGAIYMFTGDSDLIQLR